jgi:preprotein translocase subunit SecE
MNKLGQMVAGTKTFLGEVQAELKKCTWPTKAELFESTVVVIVSIFILGMAVGFSDLILMWLLNMVTG